LPQVTVITPTPLLGSGTDCGKLPVQKDITLQGPPSLSQAVQTQGQGGNQFSSSGNPFKPDHGFETLQLQGIPQGIAVYVSRVRFNHFSHPLPEAPP
jgi:hypothetical protein